MDFEIMQAVKLRHPNTEEGQKYRAIVLQKMNSAFGITYRLLWNDGRDTIMHEDRLEASTLCA
jgi:hypothetical protein